MRSARRHGQLKWITEISVTPLLDLVFILLFAFMVALPLVSRTDTLLSPSTPSPSATSAATAPTPTETFTLTLLHSDALTWNGADLPPMSLETRLIDAVRSSPNLGVIVEMPPDLPVSRLITPMAALQKAGVKSTAIRLTPPSTP
jgi:biopolymer transport protein ExbD